MNINKIKDEIIVKDIKICVMKVNNVDYISLTDLAKYANKKDPSGVIRNWMSNKNSFDYYSLWEEINNDCFNFVKSHRIKIEEVGYNRFSMTPRRWKNDFNAIGIIPSSGKYSIGTFAHPDIAFEFASWLSPEFKLYLIKEFQRLKLEENKNNKQIWSFTRLLSKINYDIHTDAINQTIVPTLTSKQISTVYAEEADILNVALFGVTSKEWERNNVYLAKYGNIRDYADIMQLIILSNLENINAELIRMGFSQSERLLKLNNIAKQQIKLLNNNNLIKSLYNKKLNQ